MNSKITGWVEHPYHGSSEPIGLQPLMPFLDLADSENHSMDLEQVQQLQFRLLKQSGPKLSTLECVGSSLPAQRVGGDYFGLLPFKNGELGIILADISGKGLEAAIMMASLKSILTTQMGKRWGDLPAMLKSVNSLFRECTERGSFASLFLSQYDEESRHLRYVNCGHNPPLLVHPDDTTSRLVATATPLGLFENWECTVGTIHINQGDVLLIYSDGVTESPNHAGAQFGTSGLLRAFRSWRNLSLDRLVPMLIGASLGYAGYSRADDLTLVVARGL